MKFKNKIVVLFVTAIVLINLGIGIYVVDKIGALTVALARMIGNMRSALQKIAESSDAVAMGAQNIENIIKVIDEIAFQTSIRAVETRIAAVGLASAQQTQSIHEINSGISIIDNVVHTNSATAEETAAASEVLFSQAEILEKQTNQFKLQ